MSTRAVGSPSATGGRTARIGTAAVLLAVLAVPPVAAPAPAVHSRPTADITPPGPPPLRADPPPGRRPGAAPGLRRPASCAPPAPDEPPVGTDPGAERMQLAAAHRLATGSGQVIAVIDTGVHPDPRFGPRLRGGGDYLTGGDGLDDCDGHGTAVAGILAAGPEPAGRGRGGFVGIAPDAQVLSIRQSSLQFEVPGPDGVARPAGDVATLAEAIVLAVREGASVINISEAVCLPAARAATQGASIQAALRYAARSDVVVVAAAGNAGSGSCVPATADGGGQVSLPGWYGDDILAVGAVGPDDAPAAFTVPGPWVDVAAPGTNLRSVAVGGGTTDVDGTSFAAPWVAGLAALVRERFPALSASQVVDRLLATARRAPGGHDDALGYGVIDPMAALTAVPEVLTPAAPGAPAPAVDLPAGIPPTPPSSGAVDLVAAAGLFVTGGASVWVLLRRPRRRPA